MRCRGLHCGGCRSAGGGSGLMVALLVAALVGSLVLYRAAGAATAGLSASVADANRAVGAAVAVVLVLVAVTGCGWVLLARRRQVREAPQVAEFSERVQAALDARARRGRLPIVSGPQQGAAQLERVTVYRLDSVSPQDPQGWGLGS